jgi:protein-L-isoaspartate O-methyltransferase
MTLVREHDPDALRTAMVSALREADLITSERVAAAFNTVSRHGMT